MCYQLSALLLPHLTLVVSPLLFWLFATGTGLPADLVVSLVLRQPQLSAMNPYIKPWSAELTRIIRRSDGSPQWYSDKAAIAGDMNPAHHIYFEALRRTL